MLKASLAAVIGVGDVVGVELLAVAGDATDLGGGAPPQPLG